MNAAEIVKALGGRGGMARCPAHDDRTPSLSVSEGSDGKLLVHCHAGCNQADVWAALKVRGFVGQNGKPCRYRDVLHAKQETPAEKRAAALAIWEKSVPALHTPAEEYLRCRGIVIQPPQSIRYHEGINALVAAIQAQDGHITGVQRIFLGTDRRGTWATGKKSLGPIKGGACRLTAPAEQLQLCESIEDGLALLQMIGRPTWAVPGAVFMENFEPPPEVREVVLAPDNDKAGLEAIEKAAKNLVSERHQVRRLLPPHGKDWCDVLETFEERAGIREFDGEQDRETAEQRSWAEAFCNGD
jgi:hypothetical protein